MWGFGSPDDGKQKQIDSLRQTFPTVKEVVKNSVYEVPLTLPNRSSISFRINLPNDFPKALPPNVQVLPPVQHRLVDQQMNVMPQAHENLQRWNNNANLGRTVGDIVQKFLQDPPVITPQPNIYGGNSAHQYPYQQQPQQQQAPPSSAYGKPPSYLNQSNSSSSFSSNSSPMNGSPNQVHHVAQPVVPSNFPELERKTPAELSQMISDETEFNKFFESLPVVQNMKKIRDDLRTNNEDLAKKTMMKESEIDKLRSELAASSDIIQQQRAAFEVKQHRQQEVMKQFSTPALVERLSEASQMAEIESEEIANRFLAGEMDYKDFIREFMEKRKLYHLRSAKKEQLSLSSQR